MPFAYLCLAALLYLERLWKFWEVQRFFRRPLPPLHRPPALVSLLQPILSGDPTLPDCLEANLRCRPGFPVEFIWMLDDDDAEGLRLCRELAGRYPGCDVRLVPLPPPQAHHNPKTVKLIAGLELARGDVICVLDDDTRLPDGGLQRCLPFLDQPGVGLAFGLPYYLSFMNLWSALVAGFVNSHSLMTYLPYLRFSEPVTINGMFYALRREVLDQIGGFTGLERVLADDFAIARRVRDHGYTLAQTPLLHGISTCVSGPRHFLSLIQRWFIFPRASLMRYLDRRQLAILYGVAFAPMFSAWLLLGCWLFRPAPLTAGGFLGFLALHYVLFAWNNRSLLHGATPWSKSWLVPVLQLMLPLQILVALLSPPRILWRGHLMQAGADGGFQFLRRRSEPDDKM